MRLLIISKTFIPYSHHRKLEEIANLGVELHLISPESWAGVKMELNPSEIKKYQVYILPVVFNGKNHFYFYQTNCVSWIKKINPDIICLHEEPYSFVSYQWLLATKKFLLPAIFLTDQNIFKTYPFPFSYFERFTLANTAGAMVINRDGLAVLRKKGYNKPIRQVVEVGVDENDFRKIDVSHLRQRFNLSDKFVVGYIGRLVWEKGWDILLLALANLVFKRNYKDVVVVFIGSGPDKEKILKRIKMFNLNNNVLFLGYVDSRALPEYVNLFDCFVLPSRELRHKLFFWKGWKEQFGRVLTEAMAAEVPVIGSTSGEIPNVIGDAGMIFPENDWENLAARIEELKLNPELRRKLGKKDESELFKIIQLK